MEKLIKTNKYNIRIYNVYIIVYVQCGFVYVHVQYKCTVITLLLTVATQKLQ